MSEADSNLPLWLAFLMLAREATRDSLTGLYNRRFFDETLANQAEAARRYDRHLSLVLFDLDRFKQINDDQGHAAGDQALKSFADTLTRTARSADIVCRYGGDEFAVLLPETDQNGAEAFAERITQVSEYPVSAGSAETPCENLLEVADLALRTSKQS